MSKNRLDKNQDLRRGQYLISNNGLFRAVFQENGDFVVLGPQKLWSAGTAGSDATRLTMQPDSNLVLYNDGNTARWDTKTYVPMPRPPHSGTRYDCHLELTDDGTLVLHRGPDKPWNSADSGGVKGN